MGVRGGNVDVGKIGIIPGGHIDYQIPEVKEIYSELKREFEEEIGMKFDETKHIISPIGVMGNDSTIGINILNSLSMNNSFEEILNSWKKSKDRFEHGLLFKANYKEILEISKTGKIKKEGLNYEATPYFQDCLKHFVENYKYL